MRIGAKKWKAEPRGHPDIRDAANPPWGHMNTLRNRGAPPLDNTQSVVNTGSQRIPSISHSRRSSPALQGNEMVLHSGPQRQSPNRRTSSQSPPTSSTLYPQPTPSVARPQPGSSHFLTPYSDRSTRNPPLMKKASAGPLRNTVGTGVKVTAGSATTGLGRFARRLRSEMEKPPNPKRPSFEVLGREREENRRRRPPSPPRSFPSNYSPIHRENDRPVKIHRNAIPRSPLKPSGFSHRNTLWDGNHPHHISREGETALHGSDSYEHFRRMMRGVGSERSQPRVATLNDITNIMGARQGYENWENVNPSFTARGYRHW